MADGQGLAKVKASLSTAVQLWRHFWMVSKRVHRSKARILLKARVDKTNSIQLYGSHTEKISQVLGPSPPPQDTL